MAIIGRYLGARELGAVGNAANIIMLFLVVSGGFEMAVDVMVSRLLGASKKIKRRPPWPGTPSFSVLLAVWS